MDSLSLIIKSKKKKVAYLPFILIFLRSNTGHEVCGVYMIFYMYYKVYSVMYRVGDCNSLHTHHTHTRTSELGIYCTGEEEGGYEEPRPAVGKAGSGMPRHVPEVEVGGAEPAWLELNITGVVSIYHCAQYIILLYCDGALHGLWQQLPPFPGPHTVLVPQQTRGSWVQVRLSLSPTHRHNFHGHTHLQYIYRWSHGEGNGMAIQIRRSYVYSQPTFRGYYKL